MNTRQQTERDPRKAKRKLGTVEQMIQVFSLRFCDLLSCSVLLISFFSSFFFVFCFC